MGVWGLRPQRVQGGARWGVQGGKAPLALETTRA
jgi:hypothetical protein